MLVAIFESDKLINSGADWCWAKFWTLNLDPQTCSYYLFFRQEKVVRGIHSWDGLFHQHTNIQINFLNITIDFDNIAPTLKIKWVKICDSSKMTHNFWIIFWESFSERTSFHFSTTIKRSESTLLHACFSDFGKGIDSMITPTLWKDFEPRILVVHDNFYTVLCPVILLLWYLSPYLVQNPRLNINWHQIDSGFGSSWLEKEMNSIINPFWTRINARDHHTATEHAGWWLTGQHLRIEPVCPEDGIKWNFVETS